MKILSKNPRPGDVSMEDLIPKKIRFHEDGVYKSDEEISDLSIVPKASCKDKLVGHSKLWVMP